MRAINRASAVNLTASATATAQCEDGVVHGTEDRAECSVLPPLPRLPPPVLRARAPGRRVRITLPNLRDSSRGTFTFTKTPRSRLPAFTMSLSRAAVRPDRRDAPCFVAASLRDPYYCILWCTVKCRWRADQRLTSRWDLRRQAWCVLGTREPARTHG